MHKKKNTTILAPRGFKNNDHLQAMFYLLAKEGFDVDEFSFAGLFKRGEVIWNIHWINQYIRGTVINWGINKPFKIISYLRATLFFVQLHVARFVGVKIIWSVHNLEMHSQMNSTIERVVTRKLLSMANRVTAFNEYIKSELATRYGVDNAYILRQGGYGGRFTSPPAKKKARRHFSIGDEEMVFLFFGNVMYYKGVDILVNAFSEISQPNIRLILAGSSRNEPEFGNTIKNMVGRLGNDRIMLMDQFIDKDLVPSLFACSDYTVYPYRKVSNSGVMFLSIEFMTPMIIADKGGVGELFTRYGDLGLLIRDVNVEAVRSAIILAVQERKDFSENIGRARAELDWHNLRNEIVGCFML